MKKNISIIICLIISHISANATDTLGAIMRCDTICSKVVIYTNESVEVCNIGGITAHYEYGRFKKFYTLSELNYACEQAEVKDTKKILRSIIWNCVSEEKIDSIKKIFVGLVISLAGNVDHVYFPIIKSKVNHSIYLTSEDYYNISEKIKQEYKCRTWKKAVPYVYIIYGVKLK